MLLGSRATVGSSEREEVLEGVVEDILFRSDDGRFTVAHLAPSATAPATQSAPGLGSSHTIVGDLGAISAGEHLRVVGRWTRHAVYGQRFRVSSFTPTIPETEHGMIRYLGSGLIPGIGPALAARLVEQFGARTLDVIATQSARLREVPGTVRDDCEE